MTVNPNDWFKRPHPELAAAHGDPIRISYTRAGDPYVADISDDFFAAWLGQQGNPESPTIYVGEEGRFYRYLPEDGIFTEVPEEHLTAALSDRFLRCARECAHTCDTGNLMFRLRSHTRLATIIRRARERLRVPMNFFDAALTEFIPCANGMLRLSDKTLHPFSPSFRRRNKLPVKFDPDATCPMFLDKLMKPALKEEDLDLLQRWTALALIGTNIAQRFGILSGTAGGGKGTFIRVLQGIIGANNIGALRPKLLQERFEVGRLVGKTLLYGADVSEQFLNCGGATMIKSITGGDPLTAEFKGSNERPQIMGTFNVVLTCNSRLRLYLEDDRAAWERRIFIIPYENPPPTEKIADLSEQILAQEPSGVLNWVLGGYGKLKTDGFQLILNERQQRLVSDILQESENHIIFARQCIAKDPTSTLTVSDCYTAYVEFCARNDWAAQPRKQFGGIITETITHQFAVAQRNDIPNAGGKEQRGWKGIRLTVGSKPTAEPASEPSELPLE